MVVVTGANGFIGSAFVRELNSQGIEDIWCVDPVTLKERSDPLGKATYRKFVSSEDLFDELFSLSHQEKPSFFFHLGACSSTTEMNRDYLRRTNTEYSQKVFEFCRDQKVPLIYASSGAVYGDGQQGFDDRRESSVYKPLNPYGESKWKFDVWALEQNNHPPRWYGLRFFNVYGPNEYHKGNMASLVYKAFGQIKETGQLKLFRSHHPDYKDGEQLRDFVYVKDITRWMVELTKAEDAPSGVYNMGFGKARTWLDLASAVFSNMDRPMQINWIDIPENIRHQYQYFTEAKMDKWNLLGLSDPQWSVEKGVKDYVRNYLSQGDPFI